MTEQEQKTLYLEIGQIIREIRLNTGFSQEVFAQMLHLTRASIVNIEKGRQRTTIHLLYEIGKIANVNIVDLLPKIKREDELSMKWKEKIGNVSDGNALKESKLTDFLNEIISKGPK